MSLNRRERALTVVSEDGLCIEFRCVPPYNVFSPDQQPLYPRASPGADSEGAAAGEGGSRSSTPARSLRQRVSLRLAGESSGALLR